MWKNLTHKEGELLTYILFANILFSDGHECFLKRWEILGMQKRLDVLFVSVKWKDFTLKASVSDVSMINVLLINQFANSPCHRANKYSIISWSCKFLKSLMHLKRRPAVTTGPKRKARKGSWQRKSCFTLPFVFPPILRLFLSVGYKNSRQQFNFASVFSLSLRLPCFLLIYWLDYRSNTLDCVVQKAGCSWK